MTLWLFFFPILLNPNGFVHGQCFDCILWIYFVGSPFWWLVWQNYSHNSVPLILQNKTTKKIQTEDISDPVCLRKMQHYKILVINSLQSIQYIHVVRCLHCMPSKNFHLSNILIFCLTVFSYQFGISWKLCDVE